MKIIFLETDTLGNDVNLTQFDTLGEVIKYPGTIAAQVPQRIKDADIIIANKLPMNETTLVGAKDLKLICLTATGTNNIDFDYTNLRNIRVTKVV